MIIIKKLNNYVFIFVTCNYSHEIYFANIQNKNNNSE